MPRQARRTTEPSGAVRLSHRPSPDVALAFTATILDPPDGLYDALAGFTADFVGGVYEQLVDSAAEVVVQRDTLRSLFATVLARSGVPGLRKAATGPADFLKTLARDSDTAVRKFVAVVPAADSGEIRQPLAPISHAVGCQAGVVSFRVTGDATPDGAFEEASI